MSYISNTVQTSVCQLLSSALWNRDLPDINIADIEAVCSELRSHTVDVLPTDILCKIDPENRDEYIKSAAENMMLWYPIMQEQEALCAVMRSAEIPFVILKGSAACVYYPRPEYRVMGDIDVLVKPEDFPAAVNLLTCSGYEFLEIENPRHAEFLHNGVCIELHKYFSVFNDRNQFDLLEKRLVDGIDNARYVSLENFFFPMLPTVENGLVLLTHIGQHLETGLGLRQIIDWMMFVDRELDNNLWNSAFYLATKQINLDTLAITVTKMCRLYLGLSADITWCNQGDDDLCRDLLDMIFGCGNFGRKTSLIDRSTPSTLLRFSGTKNPLEFFRCLQDTGCKKWALLKKHPRLKPFAWLYQICRFVKLTVQRRQFFTIFRNSGESRRRGKILDRLGVVRRGKALIRPD